MSKERLIGELLLTAAPLGNDYLKELLEQARLFGGENGPAWKAVSQRIRKAGLPDQPKPKHPLFAVIATTEQGEISEKATKRCFAGYTYRDDDLDRWLGAMQPASEAGVITTLGFKKGWLFAEAARALTGVEQAADMAALGRSLIENGYTMTLAQAEDMVERAKRGEQTGMRTDGYGNFFFVETGDPKNPVSVGHVFRYDGWDAHVQRLGGDGRWGAGNRFLVRNLDASKL